MRLVKEDGSTLVCNVEYNQVKFVLPTGDVADLVSGNSPFPGNINVFIAANKPYSQVLQRTKGIIAEFINPKYKDDTRTSFKSPTPLKL